MDAGWSLLGKRAAAGPLPPRKKPKQRVIWPSADLYRGRSFGSSQWFPIDAFETDKRAFRCPHCETSFNKKRRLRSHLIGYHGAGSFECQNGDCSQTFSTEATLAKHRKSHEATRYVCSHEDCSGFAPPFATWTALQQHMKAEHPSKAKRKAKAEASLAGSGASIEDRAAEIRVALQPRPVKRWSCPQSGCNFKGRKAILLARHLERVHGESRGLAGQSLDLVLSGIDELAVV